jgi:glycyl-tRNA synthetase
VAPIKVAIFRLTNNAALDTVAVDVNKRISSAGLVTRVDSSSATVGRRYARADELGIPFGVTVDFESLLDSSVTIRERDSMAQVRVPMTHVASLLQALCTETKTWAEVVARYPLVSAAGEGDDEGEEDAVAAKAKAEKKAAAAEPKALTIDNCRRAMFSRPTVPIIK